MKRRRAIAALVSLVGLMAVLMRSGEAAEFAPDEIKALTAIVEKGMAAERQPGLNVGIWAPGRGEWVQSFGTADIATDEPMEIGDHVRIASITKTFVAVATLQLVDQGRLSLEDRLASYIEGIPNGDRITIRNLLGMTSGIYDFTMDEKFDKDFEADPLMPFGIEDVIAIVQRHEPEFAPGEKVSYCDTNYVFLGVILQKVTGKRVEQVLADQIMQPLNLRGTSYPDTPDIPEPFAHGYFAGDDGKGDLKDYTRTNPAVASTAGAMISTVEDLRIWAKALVTGSLLKPETHAEQMKFGTIPTPGGITLGYGLGIANFGGLIGHNGAILGYSTAMFYLPEADATIVLAGNQASNFSNATTNTAYRIAAYLFPEKFKKPE